MAASDKRKQRTNASARLFRKADLLAVSLITGLLWVGRYWRFRGFGLYEDDHHRISMTLHLSWQRLVDHLELVAGQFGLGRVGHELLIYLHAALGWRLGGLGGMHLLGFTIHLVNNVLFYFLLRRLAFPRSAAAFGGIIFALFPLDSTQIFLTHAFGIHPGISLLLISAHLFLSRRRWLATLAIAPTPFIYESIFPVFLAVPWLAVATGQIRWKLAAAYSAAAATALGLLAYLRVALGDYRSVQAAGKFGDVVGASVRQVLEGPFLSLGWTFLIPFRGAPDAAHVPVPAVACAFASCATLCWLWWKHDATSPGVSHRGRALRFMAIGFAMLLLAYPLVFELPLRLIQGRSGRVHLVAAVGAAFFLAASVWLGQCFLGSSRLTFIPLTGLALLGGLLILTGLRVQAEYVRAWDYQRALWTDVVEQSPDLAPGTLILVETEHLRDVRGFWPWSWEHSRLAERLFDFPRDTVPPRLFFMKPEWREHVASTGDILDGVRLMVHEKSILEEHRGMPMLFYRAIGGRLQRAAEPIRVDTHEFEISLLPDIPAPTYPRRPLYGLLVLPPGAERADYLVTPQ